MREAVTGSRAWFFFIRVNLAIAVLAAILFQFSISQVYAGDPVFSIPLPPGFRIGMEIELQASAFVGLTRYFDFARLQLEKGSALVRHLPPDFFDDYLRNYQQGLFELPEDLRKKLTEGLQLEDVTFRKDQALLNIDGKKIEPQSQLIFPNSAPTPKTILVDALSQQPPQKASGSQASIEAKKPKDLVLPKRVAWETLFDRWKALSFDEKKSLVHWENLSPSKKAVLAVDFANGEIKLKHDLPPQEKRLFERFHWSLDVQSHAIEFRHRESLRVEDPNEFFEDVLELSRRAGVEHKILNPVESKNRAAGLHFHISVKGKDLRDLSKALNKLFMIERINTGNLADLTETKYVYRDSALGKGLIRLHSFDRVEFRTHIMPLRDELRFILALLSLDSQEAVKIVDAEIKKRMTDYVVDRIGEYRSEYLQSFTRYMSPEQLHRAQPKIDKLAYFNTLAVRFKESKKFPEEFLKLAPELVGTKDVSILNATKDLVAHVRTQGGSCVLQQVSQHL